MKKQYLRWTGIVLLTVLWLGLAVTAWVRPSSDISDAERRKLAQFPVFSGATVSDGSFMSKFETYTLDQFPLRDSFRQMKSLVHYYVLNQKDNNDIYLADGYAAKLEYPLNTTSLSYATNKFNTIYEKYLTGSDGNIYLSMVPDKGYYLAEPNGYPVMDYPSMVDTLQKDLPWAQYIDITDCLSVEDYYFTDTHWRQEKILPVAQRLAQAMGLTQPKAEDFTQVAIERPFYGVYYGQAALPLPSETMYIMENALLRQCIVKNFENGATSKIYDMTKLSSRDLYDIYLSGAASLLEITNPSATSNRELIVFRDSFGSSIVPLLVQDYRTVTVVDIRYVSSDLLDQWIDFHGQDVLLLYSSLILNSSNSLR